MKSTNSRLKKFFILKDVSKFPRKMQESCNVHGKWRLTDHLLGRGSYGQVTVVCDDESTDACKFVAKQIQFDYSRYDKHWVFNMFFAECLITQYAGLCGFGIPVHAFYLCGGVAPESSSWFGTTTSTDDGDEHGNDSSEIQRGVLILDKYDGDLESIQHELTWMDMKSLLDKVTKMHEAGILHRDLFLKNTMYKNVGNDKDVRIIDFGLSIAFERSIPKPLRAIDYLNLISDIGNKSLQRQCHQYITRIIGYKSVQIGEKWLLEHFDKCSSEYSLLRYLPAKWIQMMGPGTIDTMVWSVRCNQDLDQDIVRRTSQRIDDVSA
jgi:serine/threonine protein kinase